MIPPPRTSPRCGSHHIRRMHPQRLRTCPMPIRVACNTRASLVGSYHVIRGKPSNRNSIGVHSLHPQRVSRLLAPVHSMRCPAASSPGALIFACVLCPHSGCRFIAMQQRFCVGDSPVVASTWRIRQQRPLHAQLSEHLPLQLHFGIDDYFVALPSSGYSYT